MSEETAASSATPAGATSIGVGDLGQRVVVRIRTGGVGPSGGPEMTDIVGILDSLEAGTDGDQTWRIVRKNGETAAIRRSTVEVVKRLAPPPHRLRSATDISINDLESIAAEGWRPLESARLGDWLLRASRGFTGRGNSVLPVGPHAPDDLDSALSEILDWYRERGLTSRFAIPLPWQSALDQELATRGWPAFSRTHVLVANVPEVLLRLDGEVETVVALDTEPSPEWLDTYSYRGDPIPDFARNIMLNAEHPVFASIPDPDHPEGELLAVGRAALTRDWIGITAVDVRERARRRGLASQIMRALLDYAYARGHRFTYLQVATENEAARALYAELGYVEHHLYQYRSEPPQ